MTNAQSKPIDSSSFAKRSSPIKGRMSKKQIKGMRKKAPGWYITSAVLNGQLEMINITFGDRRNDAYFHNLVQAVQDSSDDSINSLDLLGCFRRRHSLMNPVALISPRSGYQRRCFIRLLDTHELTDEFRLAGLRVIKAFLERRENNRYDTPVHIEEGAWDMTASTNPLPNVDNYIQYRDIKRLLAAIFGEHNVGHTWAAENPEAAAQFFTAGGIPHEASYDLGFPLSVVQPLPQNPLDQIEEQAPAVAQPPVEQQDDEPTVENGGNDGE